MVDIEDFTKFKYLDYGKVFLVLYYKGFSWKKELQNEFNISNTIVTKALNILEENGFIIAKDFWSLNLDTQEIIRRLNAGYSYLIKKHPKIYTLSVEGREEGGFVIIDELNKKAKTHSSLSATIKFIKEKTKSYNILKKEFEKQENNNFSRIRIDHKTGILYETPTEKQKEFEKNLKKAVLEFKKEKLTNKKDKLIEDKNKSKELVNIVNSLSAIEKDNKKYTKKDFNKIIYNNRKISNYEFEKLNINEGNEITKIGDELINIQKNHIKRINKLKEELNIENNNINNDENIEFCKEIINNIKKKGWMDTYVVQRSCKNEDLFKLFLKLAEQNNIYNNGEDFIYKKS